jgi:ADP-dependent NAD(P)H-hydrate dehydratase / NAD(P)H-hydrate epimerase
MKLVSTAEMRQLEAAATAAGTSEAQLMEEAGLAVAQEAWMMLGSLEGRRIIVLAGPGNNGGDGLVAARHLHDWGADVMVVMPKRREPDANSSELEQREVAMMSSESDEGQAELDQLLAGSDMVIDALLGIGGGRAIEAQSPIGRALQSLAAARVRQPAPKLIAVDVPTGLDADTGAVDPLTVEPDISVTFGLPKVGMYEAPGSAVVGRVQVIDIGIPAEAMEAVPLELLTSRWMRGTLPARPEDGNKGTFGRVLVVGGSRRFAGAPLLAARAAYRAGAGLVTAAVPTPLYEMSAAALLETTWLPQDASGDGGIADHAAVSLRHEWRNFSAAVVGPGMGDSDDTRAFLWAALPDMGELTRGVVLDADGLNALAAMPDGPERLPERTVLTPHPGELARMLGRSIAEIQATRLATAQEAAERYRSVVVLKGAHTVVAAPDGRAKLSPFANPLLASGGTGDILAGMIGSYLAQGLEPFEAAALGVYLHAATGESLRRQYGDAGLLASELAEELPKALNELRGQ